MLICATFVNWQTSLLPAEEIENAAGASKDNPNKADGKKEKDKDGGKGRGGTQKGQDKKGKGGKGDTAIEYLSALPGRRTAMPPCLILPNLVDVVAAASSIQVRKLCDKKTPCISFLRDILGQKTTFLKVVSVSCIWRIAIQLLKKHATILSS